jgi:hypothetical protein
MEGVVGSWVQASVQRLRPPRFSQGAQITSFAASFARKITLSASHFLLSTQFQRERDRSKYVKMKHAAQLLTSRIFARKFRSEYKRNIAARRLQKLFRTIKNLKVFKSSIIKAMKVPIVTDVNNYLLHPSN